MKIKIAAVILALTVFCAVTANSLIISRSIDEIYEDISGAPDTPSATEVYLGIYEDFNRREKYISLTVSHEELGNIRNCFAEIIGACRARNEEDLIIAKSRLMESLLHLRRLCSVSLESIF